MSTMIIVGVGGTGSKIIEAVIHLASAGCAQSEIVPIIIDQDNTNGNKLRCTNLIKNYRNIKKCLSEEYKEGRFFSSNIITDNQTDGEPITIVPENNCRNFRSAINYANFDNGVKVDNDKLQTKLVDSIFTSKQMRDELGFGYKKRAFLGSVLLSKMLTAERNKKHGQNGLLNQISGYQTKASNELNIVICGSIFGGTGSSGIVETATFFKDTFPKIPIIGIMLLPYYKVSTSWVENSNDKGLIRSDSDMITSKIVLEMFKDRIEDIFNSLYLIGTSQPNDPVSELACAGGDEQENPAHIFEFLTAIGAISDKNTDTKIFQVFNYIYDSKDDSAPEKYRFNLAELSKVGENKNLKALNVMRDFASLLVETKDNPDSWKKRQPWYLNDNKVERDYLLQWAIGHDSFCKQMKGNWLQFYLEDEIFGTNNPKQEYYDLSAKLTINLQVDESRDISDILKSLEKVGENDGL